MELAAAGLRHAAAVLARALGADEVGADEVGPDEGRIPIALALVLALDPRAVPLALVHVYRVLAPVAATVGGSADSQALVRAFVAVLGAHQVIRAARRVLLVQLEALEASAAAGE